MPTKIVYGKYVVVDDKQVIPSGAVYIEADQIVEVGAYGALKAKHRADEILGSEDHMVIPGLVNAHGHGKGLTDIQRGTLDDTLETWKFRQYPYLDPYLDTVWASIKLLESGVTTTMHNHDLVDSTDYLQEFEKVIQGYRDCGLRLAFAPTLINRNLFVYGDNDAFIAKLPATLRRLCQNRMQSSRRFGDREYFTAVEALRKKYDETTVRIQHGPLSPQWVSDDALQEIKEQAKIQNTRIHIHILQTVLQMLYGQKKYGKSLLEHLYDISFLGKDVSCGHSVWLSERDIEILSETGTCVTHHPSCNLRVRNGIAPVFSLLRRGVCVGIGMDDKELSDDKDFIEEMRMVSKLHSIPSHRLNSDHLLPVDVFRMGTVNGAKCIGYEDTAGSLEPGKQADLVLLDLRRMTEPFCAPHISAIDLLIYRGRAADVDTVLIGGEVVLRDGRPTRVDRDEIVSRIRDSIPENYTEKFLELNQPFPGLQSEVAEYFDPWIDELESREAHPFYWLNDRKSGR